MTSAEVQIRRAAALVDRFPQSQREGAIGDRPEVNADLAALALVFYMAAKQGEVNALRAFIDTAYMLGRQAQTEGDAP